ncbi:hypothetical protein EXIGLDRAFT_833535, partial [Exidia glandulosa HHB12029]
MMQTDPSTPVFVLPSPPSCGHGPSQRRRQRRPRQARARRRLHPRERSFDGCAAAQLSRAAVVRRRSEEDTRNSRRAYVLRLQFNLLRHPARTRYRPRGRAHTSRRREREVMTQTERQ